MSDSGSACTDALFMHALCKHLVHTIPLSNTEWHLLHVCTLITRHGTCSRSIDAGDLFRRCCVHNPVEGLRLFGFAGGRCGRGRMLFRSVCAGEGRQRHNLPLLQPRCIIGHEQNITSMKQRLCGRVGWMCVNFPLRNSANVCNELACPLFADQQYNLTLTIPVKKSYPAMTVVTEWRLYSGGSMKGCVKIVTKLTGGPAYTPEAKLVQNSL